MNDLKNRIHNYLTDSGVAKTVFCKAIRVSRTHLYRWLGGEVNLSAKAAERIDSYLKRFNY